MNLRSACKSLKLPPLGCRVVMLSLVVAISAGHSASVLAANNAITDCDRLESSLRSLEVPVEDLANEVDVPSETAEGLSASGSTPVIHLTRRATHLSREVFEALPIVLLPEDGGLHDEHNGLTDASAEPAAESSPVVLAPVTPQATPRAGDPDDSSVPPEMPRFQLQMYRTDI